MDEGPPSSYLLLARDTPVYGSDGQTAGTVKKVLCEPAADIFDGLVLATPDGSRYVPAQHVAAIHARGVDLSIPCAEVAKLPLPAHRRPVKWDLDQPPPRLWEEIVEWLLEHLPHQHPASDDRLQEARERLAERERAVKLAGLASLEDLGMVLDLPGDGVERLRGHVVFLPN